MQTASDRNVADLSPYLQKWYLQLIADLKSEGVAARLIQGWRDPAYQDQLHAQGISPLTGASSFHCCTINGQPASKAFDLGIFNADGSYVADGNDPRYARAGALWKKYGAAAGVNLVWGGNFTHPKPDPDHFQIA